MEKITKTIITSTKNYEKFKRVGLNRSIKNKNVERLMKSFELTGGMSMSKPIIVDKEFNIIDGQHRLEACKRMGIPVHYVVFKDNTKNIPIYNTYQEKWGLEDYAQYWASQGNKNYQRLLEIKNKTGVSINGLIECLFNASGYKNEVFKEGRVVFEKDIEESVDFVQKMMRLCYIIKGKRNIVNKIVRCVKCLRKIKDFDLDFLIDNVMKYQAKLYLCTTSEEYLQLFTDIYNYKKKNGRLTFENTLSIKNI
jgi:hypothetical protein